MKTLLLLLTLASARAQYSLPWSTTDAGGGASAGGSYTLSGTIAQADAAPAISGGMFSVQCGYWTFPDLDRPLPELTMMLDSDFAILAWSDPGFPVVLESSNDLTLWTPVDPPPVANIWAEAEAARRFYRLRPGP